MEWVLLLMSKQWRCTVCGNDVTMGDAHGCGGRLDGLILAELRAIRQVLEQSNTAVEQEESFLSKMLSKLGVS